MDRGLRMHDHLHSIWRQVEEPARLDHLDALVHQSRGIDRDAPAHLPRRMCECLLNSNAPKGRFWSMQKGTAGSSEPDCGDFVHAAATHALMYSVMFAVDRQQGLALP